MAIISLEDAKAHLNITDDADNSLIAAKIEAAQAHLEQLLGYAIDEDEPPADLREAVRLMVGHLYENREASLVGVSASLLPLGVRDIVRERRNYSWSDAEES